MNQDAAPRWMILFEDGVARSCRERALVLESRGYPVRVRRHHDQHLLLVPEDRWERAVAELDDWERENRHWPPVEEELVSPGSSTTAIVHVGLAATALLGVHAAATRRLGHVDWVERGLCDSRLVLEGEWWRCFTALTLHGDEVHLAGNLLFGALFAGLSVRHLGGGIAAAAIVFAGALGNAMNVWLRAEPFRSLGASTSVFAAVGILAALSWQRKRRAGFGRARRIAPLIVGLWVLGLYGTGGERTDVFGHCTGLVAGVLVGARAARSTEPQPTQVQWIAGLASLLALALSWALAHGRA